jgi:hypothetical protein
LRGAKARRPASIAKAAPAKDHAGLGGIDPKDGDDASDRAGQQGWGAAEPPANLLRHKDLVGVGSPSSRVLVPGHHLGAIALADELDQGLPLGKLLGRGRWRLDRVGVASLMPPAYRPSTLALSSSAQLRRRCGGQTSQPPRKGVLRISVQFPIAAINCRSHLSKNQTGNCH